MKEEEVKEKIRRAISRSPYQWRTTRGISIDSGVPTEMVEAILETGEGFLRSRRPNARGEQLYTTREKYLSSSSLSQRLLSAITNKVGG